MDLGNFIGMLLLTTLVGGVFWGFIELGLWLFDLMRDGDNLNGFTAFLITGMVLVCPWFLLITIMGRKD